MKTEKQIQKWMSIFNCPERYIIAQINNFKSSIVEEAIKYKEIKGGGLFITGPRGTGKTHFLSAIMRKYVEDDTSCKVYFTSLIELLQDFKLSFSNQSEYTEKEWLDHYCAEVDYLFIDDVGADRITDWSLSEFYYILEQRYNQMKPTFFTSNYSLQEIAEKYGDRFSSRMSEMCHAIKLKGEDRRVAKNKEKEIK